jgi:hypothetical protein
MLLRFFILKLIFHKITPWILYYCSYAKILLIITINNNITSHNISIIYLFELNLLIRKLVKGVDEDLILVKIFIIYFVTITNSNLQINK